MPFADLEGGISGWGSFGGEVGGVVEHADIIAYCDLGVNGEGTRYRHEEGTAALRRER
jgi:hypothetical protein